MMSRSMVIALLIVITATAMLVGLRPAQAGEGVAVSVRLRDAGGAPLAAEPLTLVAFREPVAAADGCLTDGDGRCTWRVAPGLYELLARRPLDGVTQAATAEGGLRGLGVTVGETPITYHFTVAADSRLYFDAAPEAAVPQPIIPSADVLHGHAAEAVPTATVISPTPTVTPPPSLPADDAPDGAARLLLFLTLGLATGAGLHAWWRARGRS